MTLTELRVRVRASVRLARIAVTTIRAAAPAPKAKRYRCGECGKRGHNARTCEVRS